MIKIFSRFSDLKISRKIFLTFFTLFFFAITSLILNNYIFFNEAVHRVVESKADYGNRAFYATISGRFNILSALLESTGRDSKIQDLFLEGDRSGLYDYANPLFESYQREYGISGWNFIGLDGQRFLRMQQKDFFGDSDVSPLFDGVRSSQESVYGFGLSEKSFSFRVISPLFIQGKIVGFLEFTENIDDLLHRVEKDTEYKFAVVVNKKYLDKDSFFTIKKKAALRNNWGDMPDNAMVNNIIYSQEQDQCFSEDNINNLQLKKFSYQKINFASKHYECAGFLLFLPFYEDPFKVLYLINIDESTSLFNQSMSVSVAFLVITLVLVSLAIFLISRMITAPLSDLLAVIRNFIRGDMKHRFRLTSNDEIGELGVNFNLMADVLEKNKIELEKNNKELQSVNEELKKHDEALGKKVAERTADLQVERDNLEKKIAERTAELTGLNKNLEERVRERTDELQKKVLELSKFNRIAVNRELKMVELKKKLKDIENQDKI